MAHSSPKQSACANCHFPFEPGQPDEFCPRCGQENHDVVIGFGHVVEEFLEGIFHFDGKVFRTAGLLLFKPGELTRRYLQGHRVPYVPPIRLYVFISFVFFFLLSTFKARVNDQVGRTKVSELARQAVRVDSLQVLREAATRPAGVAPAQAARQAVASGRDSLHAPAPRAGRRQLSIQMTGLTLSNEELSRLPKDLSDAGIDSVLRSHHETPTFLNRLALKRSLRWHDATTAELVHQGLRALSVMMFFLLPLAALLLKGAYFRQQRYYLGHLIFTVHLHCFIFVFLALLIVLERLPLLHYLTGWLWWLPLLYFVLALKRFYAQRWSCTLLKASLLSFTYALALTASFLLVVTGGLLLF